MTTVVVSLVGSLPQLVRDLPSVVVESTRSVVATTTNSEAVVCRTVIVHSDAARLQADLERELRALLGFGGRLGR